LRARQQLGDQLNQQIEEASAEKQRFNRDEKELERRMSGLHFECYGRDPAMKAEAQHTLKIQEEQNAIDLARRAQELADRRQVAPSHLTDEDLARLRADAE